MRTLLPKIDDYAAHLESCWREYLAPREPDAPTVVSLFAGCGGSSLGYSMAGYRELLAVEQEFRRAVIPGCPDLLGRIDLIVRHGDVVRIIDFKTSRCR